MKIDLYNSEGRYKNWKAEALKSDYIVDGLTKKNSDTLIEYVFDMENGRYVSKQSKKGPRSFVRLNTSKNRLSKLLKIFQQRKIDDVRKITAKEVQQFFTEMRSGEFKNNRGEKYSSASDYAKVFKAFWNWHITKQSRLGKISEDTRRKLEEVIRDLDTSADEKPRWVYLDEEQMKTFLEECSPQYKPFLTFLYETGCRPTEALSMLVEDIHVEKGVVYADIKEEYSKTTGRKIKLLMSGKDLLEYIKRSELKPSDRLFSISQDYINRYLGKKAEELFGKGNSKAGQKYGDFSLYDIRHNSSCFWLPRYKNNSGLMYRFGWKSEKYILYYSEFLGMKDLISQEDLYIDVTKTELEKKLEQIQKEHGKKMAHILRELEKLKNTKRH